MHASRFFSRLLRPAVKTIRNARPKARPRLGVEALEDRRLMAANLMATFDLADRILHVEGTEDADLIRIVHQDGSVRVDGINITVIDGDATTEVGSVASADVYYVEATGMGGDDVIAVDESAVVEVPFLNTYLYGAEGDDAIYGGRGAGNLYGGSGRDTLDGGGGADFLLAGDGCYGDNYSDSYSSPDEIRADADDMVYSPLADRYRALPDAAQLLGEATGPELITADRVGSYQTYQRGTIHWSPETGAYEVYPARVTVTFDYAEGLLRVYGPYTESADRIRIINQAGQVSVEGHDITVTDGENTYLVNSLPVTDIAYAIVRGYGGDDLLEMVEQDVTPETALSLAAYGDDGDDTLIGGSGLDWLYGGAGINTVHTRPLTTVGVTVTLEGSVLRIVGTATADTIRVVQHANHTTTVDGVAITVLSDQGATEVGYVLTFQVSHIEVQALGGDDWVSIDNVQEPYIPSRAEVHGGDGSDTLYGGMGNDSIYGEAGSDRLYGNDGNDYMQGDDPNLPAQFEFDHGPNGWPIFTPVAYDDAIYGGAGDDDLAGVHGNDSVYGEGGRDSLYGNDGNDYMQGDDPNLPPNQIVIPLPYGLPPIIIPLENYDDLMYGGAGNDDIAGVHGNDSIFGGDGSDTLYGNDGSDTLAGENDNDFLYGGQGNDKLIGCFDGWAFETGNANDQLFGGDGSDDLWGGVGNDTLAGENDNDFLHGEQGNDLLIGCFWGSPIETGNADDVIWGGDGSDTLWGGYGNDMLAGENDNDFLHGEQGNDTLLGCFWGSAIETGNANDVIWGGDGSDTVWGGVGNDTLVGENDNDSLYGEEGNDLLIGCFWGSAFETGNAADQLFGGDGSDDLWGGDGNDLLAGENDNDFLNGEQGNDMLSGNAGDDLLFGEQGNDTIDGGAGVDEIYAGAGDDLVSTGIGDLDPAADVYWETVSLGTGLNAAATTPQTFRMDMTLGTNAVVAVPDANGKGPVNQNVTKDQQKDMLSKFLGDAANYFKDNYEKIKNGELPAADVVGDVTFIATTAVFTVVCPPLAAPLAAIARQYGRFYGDMYSDMFDLLKGKDKGTVGETVGKLSAMTYFTYGLAAGPLAVPALLFGVQGWEFFKGVAADVGNWFVDTLSDIGDWLGL